MFHESILDPTTIEPESYKFQFLTELLEDGKDKAYQAVIFSGFNCKAKSERKRLSFSSIPIPLNFKFMILQSICLVLWNFLIVDESRDEEACSLWLTIGHHMACIPHSCKYAIQL